MAHVFDGNMAQTLDQDILDENLAGIFDENMAQIFERHIAEEIQPKHDSKR